MWYTPIWANPRTRRRRSRGRGCSRLGFRRRRAHRDGAVEGDLAHLPPGDGGAGVARDGQQVQRAAQAVGQLRLAQAARASAAAQAVAQPAVGAQPDLRAARPRRRAQAPRPAPWPPPAAPCAMIAARPNCPDQAHSRAAGQLHALQQCWQATISLAARRLPPSEASRPSHKRTARTAQPSQKKAH